MPALLNDILNENEQRIMQLKIKTAEEGIMMLGETVALRLSRS